MGFGGSFGSRKSIEEMMEEGEELEQELENEQKRQMLLKLRQQEKEWKHYSDNGKKSGIDWDAVRLQL